MQGILSVANDISVVAKGNCGIPAYVDEAIHYHGTPELIAEYAFFAHFAGAKIIGGCFGIRPAHVVAMVSTLNGTVMRPFDRVAMIITLGTAWDGVDTSGVSNVPCG